MVDKAIKGFGGRQYQKTTRASNPKRDYRKAGYCSTNVGCICSVKKNSDID